MTITPLAFLSATGTDLVVDADLTPQHPQIMREIWKDVTTYRSQFVKAFELILEDLKGRGWDLDLLPNSDVNRAWARLACIERSFVLIFCDMVRTEGDRWYVLYKDHQKQYLSFLDKATLEDDDDEDGEINDGETSVIVPLRLTR